MWGDKMKTAQKVKEVIKEEISKIEVERINLTLTLEQTKALNDYCLAVANKIGRMPYAIKTKIGRMAIDEWLEKHGKDFNIKF